METSSEGLEEQRFLSIEKAVQVQGRSNVKWSVKCSVKRVVRFLDTTQLTIHT